MNKLIKIIDEWENKEFGHYECDCIPATPEQVRKLAKVIEQFIKENDTKNMEKKYSNCCNYEIYEKPNSWKEYCSSCKEPCSQAGLKKGQNE